MNPLINIVVCNWTFQTKTDVTGFLVGKERRLFTECVSLITFHRFVVLRVYIKKIEMRRMAIHPNFMNVCHKIRWRWKTKSLMMRTQCGSTRIRRRREKLISLSKKSRKIAITFVFYDT